MPAGNGERRSGERHLTLFRVGSFLVEGRRELCLIKNISAGGMLIHAYCHLSSGTPLTIELKTGVQVSGSVSWTRDDNAGIEFDQPIDVLDILSSSAGGPRPRMPRIEVTGSAKVRFDGRVYQARLCDISQGGTKLECHAPFEVNADVVVALPGLGPHAGVIRWIEHGVVGVTFNCMLSLGELVGWLKIQREDLKRAG